MKSKECGLCSHAGTSAVAAAASLAAASLAAASLAPPAPAPRPADRGVCETQSSEYPSTLTVKSSSKSDRGAINTPGWCVRAPSKSQRVKRHGRDSERAFMSDAHGSRHGNGETRSPSRHERATGEDGAHRAVSAEAELERLVEDFTAHDIGIEAVTTKRLPPSIHVSNLDRPSVSGARTSSSSLSRSLQEREGARAPPPATERSSTLSVGLEASPAPSTGASSGPEMRWAKALESSAKSELSKLLSRDTDVDVIIRNFLSEGSISRKASLCEHFKDGESLFRCHEKARKAVAVQAQKVFEALSPADQQSLDVEVGTSIAKVLSKGGGNKAYLAKIFSYVDKRKISNNMRVFPFSLLPKGDAENVFSFGEARPKTLVDMLLMALLLYTIPFLMRSEGDKLKLQTVAPSGKGRDFLDWMLEKLNLALKKRTGYNLDRAQPKKTRALPRKNYKSYDMGDVAARAAEIVLDESREESCDVQRILCSPGPVDGSPGENGRQQLETSVFSKLADLVNDKAYVINPQFSADQVGVDPSQAPETDKLRLDESSARALLKKMKGDFQTAMKLAESSGFNDADPFSAAASHGAERRKRHRAKKLRDGESLESDGEDSDNSDDDAGGNGDDDVGYNVYGASATDVSEVQSGWQLRDSLKTRCSLHVDAVLYLMLLSKTDGGILASILGTKRHARGPQRGSRQHHARKTTAEESDSSDFELSSSEDHHSLGASSAARIAVPSQSSNTSRHDSSSRSMISSAIVDASSESTFGAETPRHRSSTPSQASSTPLPRRRARSRSATTGSSSKRKKPNQTSEENLNVDNILRSKMPKMSKEEEQAKKKLNLVRMEEERREIKSLGEVRQAKLKLEKDEIKFQAQQEDAKRIRKRIEDLKDYLETATHLSQTERDEYESDIRKLFTDLGQVLRRNSI